MNHAARIPPSSNVSLLYVATALAIWLLFRLVSGAIDRVKLKEFDRQLGVVFGLAKGILYCVIITFFAVTLSETARQTVLQSRSGDCTEHSVLFAALARAVGIPTEQVAGVMYAQGFGGFAYHAWNRVYVGQWIEVDPTFNEGPPNSVNPTHIVFAFGPLERQSAIVNLMGRVRVRLLEVK
jgi:hypothetical protein